MTSSAGIDATAGKSLRGDGFSHLAERIVTLIHKQDVVDLEGIFFAGNQKHRFFTIDISIILLAYKTTTNLFHFNEA